MNILNNENIKYRLQQLLILVLHLILLKWMYYTLAELGTEKTSIVLTHYIGMSIYGAVLIRGCAAWGKYRHHLDLEKEKKQKEKQDEK
jgi:sugar phosphate permease